jgi:hypothetical protein
MLEIFTLNTQFYNFSLRVGGGEEGVECSDADSRSGTGLGKLVRKTFSRLHLSFPSIYMIDIHT